jgi:hypothetical protein
MKLAEMMLNEYLSMPSLRQSPRWLRMTVSRSSMMRNPGPDW